MNRVILLSSLVGLLAACTTQTAEDEAAASSEANRVMNIGQSSATNPNIVTGVWELTQTNGPLVSHSRFEFRASSVVAAARCTRDGAEPVVVGGRASATVTNDLIVIDSAISDQKQIGSDGLCGVSTSAGQLPVCTQPTPANAVCFELTGTVLTLHQGGTNQSFTKIAD